MKESAILERQPENEQAANALPQQLTIKHESGSHLSFKKVAAIGAAAVVSAGFIANGITNFGSDLFGRVKEAVPHTELQAEANNVLYHVGTPDKTILVEGTGTGSAAIDLELGSSGVPVGSSLWNTFVAGFTKRTASATREGKVQIGSDKGAWTLSSYFNNVKNPDKQWGIQATVDADKLFLQRADMQYAANSSGKRIPDGYDAELVKLASVFGIDSGMAERTGDVTTISDDVFEDTCGPALRSDIPTGVGTAVKAEVLNKAELFQTQPDMQQAAKKLAKMASLPVRVVIQRTRVDGHGQLLTQTIDPSAVALPQTASPTRQEIATVFHLPLKSVRVNATDCYFTGPAIQDQEHILAQSASSTTPTKVVAQG